MNTGLRILYMVPYEIRYFKNYFYIRTFSFSSKHIFNIEPKITLDDFVQDVPFLMNIFEQIHLAISQFGPTKDQPSKGVLVLSLQMFLAC